MERDFPHILRHCRVQIAIIGLLALASVVCWAAMSWYAEPRLQDLRSRQLLLQQQVRQRQLDFARTGVPVSVLERLEKNIGFFHQLVPPIDRFSMLLGDLFDLAEKAGLSIHQISYRPEHDKESGYVRYGLNFSVDGTYPDIKKFLYLLENAERILIIQNIAVVGRATEQSASARVSLTIDLVTYFREKAA